MGSLCVYRHYSGCIGQFHGDSKGPVFDVYSCFDVISVGLPRA